MCDGWRSGEVGMRIITQSGRYRCSSRIHATACCITGRCGVSSAAQRRRPHERHVAAELARDTRRFFVVGGQDQAIERARGQRALDGVADQRLAASRFVFLPGMPFDPARAVTTPRTVGFGVTTGGRSSGASYSCNALRVSTTGVPLLDDRRRSRTRCGRCRSPRSRAAAASAAASSIDASACRPSCVSSGTNGSE